MATRDDEYFDEGFQDRYIVVVNPRGDYSVWARRRPVPQGWEKTRLTGSRSECIGHVNRILARSAEADD